MADAPHIQDLLAVRRRTLLMGLAGLPLLSLAPAHAQSRPLGFQSVPANLSDDVSVPAGYRVQTLIAWGDAMFDEMPEKADLNALTRADQEKRWGMNNDMLMLFPASFAFPPPRDGDEFLLCANHEYFDPGLMFPANRRITDFTGAQIEAAFASMGASVVRVRREGSSWRMVRESAPGVGLNRRITPFTPVAFGGPAANHPWVLEAAAFVNAREPAPAGTVSCGTMANCAGGRTPWGTYLTAEENFQSYFYRSDSDAPALTTYLAQGAYVLDAGNFGYSALTPNAPLFQATNMRGPAQFDLSQNPGGPALYGWIVEIDPYDSSSTPKKRTALGRKKAECATTALTRDGRVAVYMGDDQINEYLYKFVTRRRFNPADRAANMDLLDEGKLYVARMEEDGSGRWIEISLSAANRAARAAEYPHVFRDAGDLMMRSREAARLLGATPLDRPEDVEALIDANWVGEGPVLVVCTNNREQDLERPGSPAREGSDGVQPNLAGHILRLDEAGGDCGATRFRWDVFALAGDPDATLAETPSGAAAYVSPKRNGADTFSGDRFACPDNLCIDSARNVWIATDGSDSVFGDCNDSVLVARAAQPGAPPEIKRFLVGPPGAEICGPLLAPDERAFLAAIQHPGDGISGGPGAFELRFLGNAPLTSHFPDGGDAFPRSAVIVVTREDGGPVGG